MRNIPEAISDGLDTKRSADVWHNARSRLISVHRLLGRRSVLARIATDPELSAAVVAITQAALHLRDMIERPALENKIEDLALHIDQEPERMNLQVQITPELSISTRNQAHHDYVCRGLEKLGPNAFECLYASRSFLCSMIQELPLDNLKAMLIREWVDKIDRLTGLVPPGEMT